MMTWPLQQVLELLSGQGVLKAESKLSIQRNLEV